MTHRAEIVEVVDWINVEHAANPYATGGMRNHIGIALWPYPDERLQRDARMMRLWREYATTRRLAAIPDGWPTMDTGKDIAERFGAASLWHVLYGAMISGEYKTTDFTGHKHKILYAEHDRLGRFKAFAVARQALRNAIAKQFNQDS